MSEQPQTVPTGGSAAPDETRGFVPYRNSALTWILKDSLGGNSKTAMLATISPIGASFAESMNTLRYVERAKLIVNKVKINDGDSQDPYIQHLQGQVAAYKGKLNAALLKMRLREVEYQEHLRQRQKELEQLQAELSRLKLEHQQPGQKISNYSTDKNYEVLTAEHIVGLSNLLPFFLCNFHY